MIPPARPLTEDEEIRAVTEVLRSGMLAQGKKVRELEEAFAEYIGTRHAVCVSSGTSALHIACRAHGIGAGDEVITTPFTFAATADAIFMTGARPVFVDVEKDTFNIDAGKIKDNITEKTKAILPVHLFGQCADMDRISEISKDNDLIIIEDAAQAHGAKHNGTKAGAFGTGCFSFYATKNMCTGEGGIITTDDKELADRCRIIRDGGMGKKYHYTEHSLNFAMNDIEAAIGVEQLKKLDIFNIKRQENAKLMTNLLKDTEGILLPITAQGNTHVYHQYTIRITESFPLSRDELTEHLRAKEIYCGVHYPLPLHKQESYIRSGYRDDHPISEMLSGQVLSLPIHPAVSEDDIRLIAESVKEVSR